MQFSVITVVWNDLEGLIRTGKSLDAQTVRDFEWIVVDGRSEDGTVEWLENAGSDDLSWISERDEGHYDAMNKGIQKARGDYLIFMNAGDEFSGPNVLEQVRDVARDQPPPDFIYGDTIDVAQNGGCRYRRARDHKTLWWTMFACHQAMFFRRGRIGSIRYRLNYRTAADYAFVAEVLGGSESTHRQSARVERIDAALCRFWLGGVSWTQRRSTISEDFLIRSRHLGVSPPSNVALFLAHHVHTWLKRHLPGLTRRLRYSRPEEGMTETG